MRRELRDAWVAALRSKTFKQAYGVLKKKKKNGSNPSYCCLGVLCEVAPDDEVVLEEEDDGYVARVPNATSTDDVSFTSLPNSFASRHGLLRLLDGDEDEIGLTIMNELIFLNDERRYDFDQIADWIEENVPVDE